MIISTLLVAFSLSQRPPGLRSLPRVDPMYSHMRTLCSMKPACIAGQQRAVSRFLQALNDLQPPRWRVQRCIREGRGKAKIVDWVKVDGCVRRGEGVR